MEVNNELVDDMPEYEMEDQDDGTNDHDLDHQDGPGDNSSEYSSNTDSEQEIQMPVRRRSNKKRGLTRLPRLRTEHTNSGGRRKHIRFDELGRFSGKHRAVFVSYLGDLVREKVGLSVLTWKSVTKEVRDKLWEEIIRFFEVDETRRKFVMNRLGILLLNFRRKLYADYIKPHLGNSNKLAKIPRRYRTILRKQDEWNNFVTYTQSEEFNYVSKRTIVARSKSNYSHRMGRGACTTLRDKLIENKLIGKEEIPPRSVMWCKARENKAGEFKDANVKQLADKLMEQEKQIKDGDINLEPGTDAMTLVFGKENGGFLKGVGTGVTAARYFHVPRTKGSSKQEIADLKVELENGKREIQKKDAEMQKKDAEMQLLSTKVNEQDQTLKLVLAHLTSKGADFSTMLPIGISLDKVVDSTGTPDAIITKPTTLEPVTPAFSKTTKKTVQSKPTNAITDIPSHSMKSVTPPIFSQLQKL